MSADKEWEILEPLRHNGEYEAWRQPEMLTAVLHSGRIFSAGITFVSRSLP